MTEEVKTGNDNVAFGVGALAIGHDATVGEHTRLFGIDLTLGTAMVELNAAARGASTATLQRVLQAFDLPDPTRQCIIAELDRRGLVTAPPRLTDKQEEPEMAETTEEQKPALDNVVENYVKLGPLELDDTPLRVKRRNQRKAIKALRKQRKQLLPCQVGTRMEINDRINALKGPVRKVPNYHELDLGFVEQTVRVRLPLPSGVEYPDSYRRRDNPEAMTLPRFVFFPVFGQKPVTLTLVSSHIRDRMLFKQVTCQPEAVATVWKECYACDKLSVYDGRDPECVYKTSLSVGTVPESVQRTIKKERKNFDSLYFVQDSPKWSLESVTPTRDPDPLLVGFLGDKCYLLDKFDLTPAEEHVAREWRK